MDPKATEKANCSRVLALGVLHARNRLCGAKRVVESSVIRDREKVNFKSQTKWFYPKVYSEINTNRRDMRFFCYVRVKTLSIIDVD